MMEITERKWMLDEITFGLISSLEQNVNITDTRFAETKPVQHGALQDWEEKNKCRLPNDLREYYLTTNGMTVQWSSRFSGKLIPIGLLKINSLHDLINMKESLLEQGIDETLLDDVMATEDNHVERTSATPWLNDCFILQDDVIYGKVILSIPQTSEKNGGASIWFLDRSFLWHFLASSFTKYLRMLVFHMGIRGWQYSFTDVGLPPDVQKWFNYFLPQANDIVENPILPDKLPGEFQANKVDFTSVFKHKSSSKRKPEQSKQSNASSHNKQTRNRSNMSRHPSTRK